MPFVIHPNANPLFWEAHRRLALGRLMSFNGNLLLKLLPDFLFVMPKPLISA